jgi:hypothetical protein
MTGGLNRQATIYFAIIAKPPDLLVALLLSIRYFCEQNLFLGEKK